MEEFIKEFSSPQICFLLVIRGRNYVLPDDIKNLVYPVFGHIIIIKSDARLHGFTVEKLLADIIKKATAPVAAYKSADRIN